MNKNNTSLTIHANLKFFYTLTKYGHRRLPTGRGKNITIYCIINTLLFFLTIFFLIIVNNQNNEINRWC